MWPYVILIILPIVFQHINIKRAKFCLANSEAGNIFAMKLFWFLLVVLLIFRHETVGIDLPVYKYIFEFIRNSNWPEALGRSPEIAWSFINKVIALFSGEFRWVMVISSLLATCFLARAYIRYSEDVALTIALFVNMSNFILLFSGLRQCIAISFGFLAFEYVKTKKLIPFIVVIAIATLFHTSAFMLVFMYPLYHTRIKKGWLLWIIPLLIVLFAFNRQIFTILGLLLSTFTDYDTQITLTGSYTMLVLIIIFAIFAFIIPDESKFDDDTMGMRNFLLLSVALQMFAPLHMLAMRMNYYYIIFIPLLIPRIIRYRRIRWNQVAILARYVMIAFFLVYFFVTAPRDNVLRTFPYHFFWQNI